MLRARQDERIIQPITLFLLRTREQQGGTGIFYHTDLRREILVPENPDDWFNPRFNLSAAGLSSKIGGQFSEIPPGYKAVHLYGVLGTIVETPTLKVGLVEGDELVPVDPQGQPCMMEIPEDDLRMLQEQNQMFLKIHANAFVQFNAQDYGEGVTEDGRDRAILSGSFWAVPEYYAIEFSRAEPKSAARSAEEVHAILEKSRAKNTQRALSARAESWANRAERDERRAKDAMPPRRGTNTQVQPYGGPHFGVGTRGVPFGQ